MFHPRLYFCALVEESLAVQIQFGAVGADNLFLFIAGFHLHFFELDDGLEGGLVLEPGTGVTVCKASLVCEEVRQRIT